MIIDELVPEVNVLFVDYENHTSQWVHNAITNKHRELYASFVNGDAVTVPSHIGFGNVTKSSSENAAAFTQLKSEYARVALTSKILQSPTTARMVAAVPVGTATGDIDELGLFNAAAVSTQIHAVDATTNWSSDGTLSVVTEISTPLGAFNNLEGTGALQSAITGNGGTQTAFDNWALTTNAQAYDASDYLQYWFFTDSMAGLNAAAGQITTRLYTGGNSNYYQWVTSITHIDLGGTVTSEAGRTLARTAVSLGGATTGATGWYHHNLKFSDATATGSPNIATTNVSRLEILTTTNASTNFSIALDDVRVFSATGDLWARVEPPTTIIKGATTLLGIFWFLTSVSGAAEEHYTGFDRETVTVTTSAISLTAATITPVNSTPAREALMFIRSGGPINWTVDSTAPTSTTGSGPWYAGTSFVITGSDNLNQFQAIRETSATSDAVLEVEYLR